MYKHFQVYGELYVHKVIFIAILYRIQLKKLSISMQNRIRNYVQNLINLQGSQENKQCVIITKLTNDTL